MDQLKNTILGQPIPRKSFSFITRNPFFPHFFLVISGLTPLLYWYAKIGGTAIEGPFLGRTGVIAFGGQHPEHAGEVGRGPEKITGPYVP